MFLLSLLSEDNYYSYANDDLLSTIAHVDLLSHDRQRRQAPSAETSATKPRDGASVASTDKAPTLVIPADPTSNPADPVSTIQTPKVDRPLLGVNGTGQRKDILLSSAKPTLVSDPINSDDKETYQVEEEILDSIDTPSNDTAEAIEATKRNYTITTQEVHLATVRTNLKHNFSTYSSNTTTVRHKSIRAPRVTIIKRSKTWSSIRCCRSHIVVLS